MNENVKVPEAPKELKKNEKEYEQEIVSLKVEIRALNKQINDLKIYKDLFEQAVAKMQTIQKLTQVNEMQIDEFINSVNSYAKGDR